MLRRIFSKFGDVLEVVVLPGKKAVGGSGLVEMSSRQSAIDAVNIERGFADSPLKIKLLEREEKTSVAPGPAPQTTFQAPGASSTFSGSFNDYETLVMRQMRQQEERKRLIAEMMKQDGEDDEKDGK